jgi:hypothetical protein
VGAIVGAIATGCGDDTAATNNGDAGNDSASSGTATSGASSGSTSGSTSGSRSGASSGAAAPDCGALQPVNVGTFDSGSAQWACFQQHCGAVLANCATEACCNNSILGALLCVADGGTATNCFTPALTAAMDTDASTCIVTVSTAGTCNGATDGGDGGREGGEGGTPSDASDGGTSDASGG